MNDEILSKVRRAGSIARDARELGASLVDDGVFLLKVAEEVEDLISKKGARPAFPVNISINDIAAHYTPKSDDKLKFSRGDVVKVDVGAHVDGYIGDTAMTVEIGTKNWERLIDSSSKALRMAVETVSDGMKLGNLGGLIERTIKDSGYRSVVNLTGHGMKQYNLHAGVTIPNYDDGSMGKIETGMVLAIEPFATNGSGQVGNGRSGNIFRVMNERPMRDQRALDLFHSIREKFGTLPFAERWCTRLDSNASSLLKTLVRHGLIFSYPILHEMGSGIVSQAEHTVVVHGHKCEITTYREGSFSW